MRSLVLSAMLLAALAPAAGATDSVTVHFRVDVHGAAPLAECDVIVPAGANGRAVLEQAKRDGCIESYTVREYAFGGAVRCIDDLCWVCTPPVGAAGLGEFCGAYWLMYENGALPDYGIDGFVANDGDSLQFSYEFLPLWVLYLVPPLP